MDFQSVLMGGMLKGYRTQIFGVLMALTAVASWAVGEKTLIDLLQEFPAILGGLGIAAFGAKANSMAKGLGVWKDVRPKGD